MFFSVFAVALLAEGVDRNDSLGSLAITTIVALLAEGVDRNYNSLVTKYGFAMSPSSRRAWIEISDTISVELNDRGRPPRGGRG